MRMKSSSHSAKSYMKWKSQKKENKILHDDLGRKSIVIERYEAEPKSYRSQSFLEEDCRGVRHYSKELVEILKKRGQAYRGLNSSSTPHNTYVLRRFSAFLNHRGCPITAASKEELRD